MQGRITTLAAGYGVDFAAAHQDDVRGLDRLLISRVYPEQPEFSAWDAVDDAFARLEEVSVTNIIRLTPMLTAQPYPVVALESLCRLA